MTRKVLLIGTGNIARTHASVLRDMRGLDLHGVLDANRPAAEAFARQYGVPSVFGTIAEAATSDADVVHVLTPPDTHFGAAMPFVEAGKTVLLEKPVGVNTDECERLRHAAEKSGAVVGVNQNLAFNPAYLKLKQAVESGSLGRPRYLSCVYEAPLRQLSARQFGHWMFREPLNILLEQAVHPLSQIVDMPDQWVNSRHWPSNQSKCRRVSACTMPARFRCSAKGCLRTCVSMSAPISPSTA